MYKIIFAPQFEDWLESLTQAEQDNALTALMILCQYEHQLGRPNADTLKDSKLTNLKELRIQHADKPYRAFYVFDSYRQAIMLCGGEVVITAKMPNSEVILMQYHRIMSKPNLIMKGRRISSAFSLNGNIFISIRTYQTY